MLLLLVSCNTDDSKEKGQSASRIGYIAYGEISPKWKKDDTPNPALRIILHSIDGTQTPMMMTFSDNCAFYIDGKEAAFDELEIGMIIRARSRQGAMATMPMQLAGVNKVEAYTDKKIEDVISEKSKQSPKQRFLNIINNTKDGSFANR